MKTTFLIKPSNKRKLCVESSVTILKEAMNYMLLALLVIISLKFETIKHVWNLL